MSCYDSPFSLCSNLNVAIVFFYLLSPVLLSGFDVQYSSVDSFSVCIYGFYVLEYSICSPCFCVLYSTSTTKRA